VTGIMELGTPPKVERLDLGRNSGKFSFSPLERGFGVTVGNALRRVLLSSLEGVAVTSVHIENVLHEFSNIPGVREDAIEFMLQIKQLRMKLYDVDSARVTLDIKGEGTVTAADIICPPEVEIVNPELYLFTVDDKNAHIEMTLTVETGRGYLPAGERSERLPIGDLPVDAIFTPVKRVNWSVENARVGQSTNYDKLVMEIWTDGTISPEKAMIDAAHILIKHLSYIAGVSEEMFVAPTPVVEVVSHISSETAEMPIENLDLTVRVFNSLKRTGITTVGDVIELLEKGDEAVLSIRNFGDKSLVELKAKMIEKGYIEQEIVE